MPKTSDQGQGSRPESDGPDTAKPPAQPDPPKPPTDPAKSNDVHGEPETPV